MHNVWGAGCRWRVGSRGEESSEEDPPIDITTVQDMLSSHHYKSFKISMIHKLRFTTDVQLGNPPHRRSHAALRQRVRILIIFVIILKA